MIIEVNPICFLCKHYDNNYPGHRCDAFESIPLEIWENENDHSKPLPDQKNDIVFEPINKVNKNS